MVVMEAATLCRVCGWSLDEPGWVDGLPQYVICDCCGAECGVDEHSAEAARGYRAGWAARGYPWWDRGHQPVGWSFTEQQRELIPAAYR
ncbi:conserved hypothetical protein [Kineococcus radiotolerans SRS30216 = ATCC BAA-149]|uniref:Uncharacterized protein n=1 Tax=Kineococcus radiotolerans (strain ATCC BAA-149 / DSM 14245 / SRS30216) TaxID=266940 RepID=A6WAK9_KINRD|nr:conserved hypothetical protein [Kineococcus radiotolerans SRS30216 = ATCC BAA-149]